MNWFSNLRIKSKLSVSFGIVLLFTILIIIYAVITANMIDGKYTYLLKFPQQRLLMLEDLRENFMNMRRIALIIVVENGNLESINTFEKEFERVYSQAQSNIERYIQTNNNDKIRDVEALKKHNETITQLSNLVAEYKSQAFAPLVEAARAGDFESSKVLSSESSSILSVATSIAEGLSESALNYLTESADELTVNKKISLGIFIVISSILILISILISAFMGQTILKPIRSLLDISNNLAKGNLNINRVKFLKDETGQLMQAMYKLTDTIQLLLKEMDIMGNNFDEGDIDARINVSYFEGSYRSVAERINSMTSGLVNEVITFMNCLEKFGNGNFDADIQKLPGKKVVMNENLATLRNNLKSVYGDIRFLISEASDGNLSNRVDVEKYNGDWAKLLKGLNRLMETIVAPINEASEVLHKVSLGNFEYKIEGDYKGDFMLIKNSINSTITNVASYIYEISAILGDMADHDNLNQEITRDYVGNFSNIKIAINNIISKFNAIVYDILSAADQVAIGARQVSENSMTLAKGATEQASSIGVLNSTVSTLNDETNKNAENAKNAESLSSASKQNALSGDHNMNEMLNSMESINDASNNIAKIIKTIDDIAFQTNLLALNAAVEAARAGDHGKGFAVVAEEVRNLAARSQSAAAETAKLIEESIYRVKDGTKIADKTAEALRIIVDDVTQVSDIITDIKAASDEQSEAINQVTAGISQITEVVQTNTSTSEEAASASQELSSQADILRNLVSVFKLRRNPAYTNGVLYKAAKR